MTRSVASKDKNKENVWNMQVPKALGPPYNPWEQRHWDVPFRHLSEKN